MHSNEKVTFRAIQVDNASNPIGQEYGTPVWSIDGESICSVTPSGDGFLADVVALGPNGNAIVTCTVTLPDTIDGDGNPVAGVVLTRSESVSVSDEIAEALQFDVSDPVAQ